MKKVLLSAVWIVALIVLLPIAMVLLPLWYIFVHPFELLHYYRSPYHKATGRKYSQRGPADVMEAFDYIAKHDLPIQCHFQGAQAYFVKDGTVLFSGIGRTDIEERDGEWHIPLFDMSMKEYIELDMQIVAPEHRELPAKLLALPRDVTQAHKECPYFYCLEG